VGPMTTLRHTFTVTADPTTAWAAIADIGAVHELAAGFVTATELHGSDRVVTFANGMVAHETVISIDEGLRRLAYSVTESPAGLTYHHGSFEVVARPEDGSGATAAGSQVVWTADVLPAEAAPLIDEMMAGGSAAIAAALDRLGAAPDTASA
jgi:hypothetical protein